jgi:hypothetical protein
MKKFWMNIAAQGSAPTARFESLDLAQKEAARIAAKNVGPVFTLEAVTVTEPVFNVSVTTIG